MDGGVEQPLPPALSALAVTGILWNIGNQARIEDALPIVRRIKTALEIELGTSEVPPDLCGHFLQCLQALWQQHHICFIDRSHRDRR